jgi:hypothetical protein
MTMMIGTISKKLKDRGLNPVETKRLIKDVANIMSSIKYCTPVCIKQNLNRLGWEGYLLDNNVVELIALFLGDHKMYRKNM